MNVALPGGRERARLDVMAFILSIGVAPVVSLTAPLD